MSLAANVLEPVEDTRYFGPAVVTEGETSDGRVLVRLGVEGPGPMYTARVAVPRGRPLAAEQEVLITGDPAGELYVVGVLGAPTSDMAVPSVLATEAGAYATVSAKSDGERLQVYSRRNELLFEYHPVSGQARVNVARGDLELGTEDGDITIKSGRTVRIDGKSIELTGRTPTAAADTPPCNSPTTIPLNTNTARMAPVGSLTMPSHLIADPSFAVG